MRVAIVHDDLVQWGGAERILEGLMEIYPDALLYTSVFDFSNKELVRRFGKKKIFTSFLQKIPGWRSLYKTLLPLYPIAFEQFDFSGFDLVISHTTRFAKSIVTKPETRHICYCHTPPRFLWHLSGDKGYGIGEILMTKLRIYDQVSARRVDHFIAGSKNASKRIEKIYRRESKVIYPFIDLERFNGVETFDGGYFVVIGRPNKYKRFDLAEAACKKIGIPLKIVSGNLDDKMVIAVLAGCRGLIIPGIEDFGLVSLEAQALGKPVVAYGIGGALETIIDLPAGRQGGKTGLFFYEQNIESLIKVLKALSNSNHLIKAEDCIANAKKFSKQIFAKNFKQTVDSLLYTK